MLESAWDEENVYLVFFSRSLLKQLRTIPTRLWPQIGQMLRLAALLCKCQALVEIVSSIRNGVIMDINNGVLGYAIDLVTPDYGTMPYGSLLDTVAAGFPPVDKDSVTHCDFYGSNNVPTCSRQGWYS